MREREKKKGGYNGRLFCVRLAIPRAPAAEVYLAGCELDPAVLAVLPNERGLESEAERLFNLAEAAMTAHGISIGHGEDEPTFGEKLRQVASSGIGFEDTFGLLEAIESQGANHGHHLGLLARSESLKELLKTRGIDREYFGGLSALWPLAASQLLATQAVFESRKDPGSNRGWLLLLDAAESYGIGKERLSAIPIAKEIKRVEGQEGRMRQLAPNEQAKQHIQSEWRKAHEKEKEPYGKGKLDFARSFAIREVKNRFNLIVTEKTVASDWLKGL